MKKGIRLQLLALECNLFGFLFHIVFIQISKLKSIDKDCNIYKYDLFHFLYLQFIQVQPPEMNSENLFEPSNVSKQKNSLQKTGSIEFQLSYDQYMMLQHYLPKKYALIEYKSGKRNQSGSNIKYAHEDAQNLSRLSGNIDGISETDGRSKRQAPSKKTDRFLQNEAPQKATVKRMSSQKLSFNLDEQMMQCYNILVQLKKHKSAYPFLQPVDPKLDGALNYFDIVKQPMDLSTVQSNLKSGQYETTSQFHGDINKIWMNSYAYNQKNSPLYKITVDIQKYYKNLCSNQGITKKTKGGHEKGEKQQRSNKDIKMLMKKEMSQKVIEEVQEPAKEADKKSVSEAVREGNLFSDDDEFV